MKPNDNNSKPVEENKKHDTPKIQQKPQQPQTLTEADKKEKEKTKQEEEKKKKEADKYAQDKVKQLIKK